MEYHKLAALLYMPKFANFERLTVYKEISGLNKGRYNF
jgi:hypothetical protein